MSEERTSDLGPRASGPKAPRWAWWVATGFGSGYLKPAPGTWGSLAALIVWCALLITPWYLPGMPYRNAMVGIVWLLTPALVVFGVWSSNLIVDETGIKDPGYIVIDEWAGQWIALMPSTLMVSGGMYFIRGWDNPSWILICPILVPFLLFRLFDIWKPWPIFKLQSLPRGWGVVVDDLMAGVYSAVITVALLPWFPTGPGKA